MGVSSLPFWLGLLLSFTWVGAVMIVIAQSGPLHTFGGVPLINWAIGATAIASPVALIWMVAAYLQRAADIQSIAEPLRRQLGLITGESGAAEARIRRFNQAIKEQLDLLKSAQETSHEDFANLMDRMRAQRNDLESFEHQSIHQVKEIQEIIRRNMQHVEQLMEDKFTMMRILDDKLVQNGDSVARQIESTRDQIDKMLGDIDENTRHLTSALERASQDSKKLSDTSRAQETSLLTAAESAAETLNGVSSKIDLSIARFLERAGLAREEAERLAGTLDAQTRSLDDFSNTLPVRVSEAETILRGVADRLYASEQMARDQAVNLGEKLATQIDGMQQMLDKFAGRLSSIDGGLQQRQQELDGVIGRIGDAADGFSQRWENSITDLNDRTKQSLARFASVNEEARRGVDHVAGELTATTERYENAASRMQAMSIDSSSHLKTITSEIDAQLAQFESLREASRQAGIEVEARSSSAMQNLQHILERLLATRDATQAVGHTLVKDLHGAVDQNEQLIGRLNEAAQMSVRALGIAAESLGRQQGEIAGQTRAAEAMLQEAIVQTQTRAQAAEKGLREQAMGLMSMLGEVQDKINGTDQRLQDFATRTTQPIQQVLINIDASTDQGLQSLSRYGQGLQDQLTRMQQFSGQVGNMGEELNRATTETLSSIEQLNARFASARAAQEETARQTLDQFASMADRLQREVSGLGDQTSQAVATLQQAAIRVGEQSHQLLQDAQNSGTQMQVVTSALQNEAAQIRSILQKQAEELGADLSRAEKQFTVLGDALKQRTDTAYSLLDRVAAHYNETTRTTAQDLDSRIQHFEQATAQAQSRAEAFNATLTQQLSLIGNGTNQLEANAGQIAASGGKAVQQLSSFTEKLALTHEAANNNAQQALARLDECNTAFMRQSGSLSEAAQTSVTLIQRAGMTFGEQAGKMLDTSHQTEQHIRNLTASTMALSEQSSQIRAGMEQQNQRLLTQLTEAVSQLELTEKKLQQAVATATSGAEQAASSITEATQTATAQLSTGHQALNDVAGRTEITLASLAANIGNQTAALTAANDQLGEQHRNITAANENQRLQLVDLFDRLGSAHGQASDVAARTIAHLTEALSQIQRQLGGLSDQSQSAIGNVRAATAGFADQAGILLQNAQQAEQQARTVLSVTSTLQDQARQLRESLHGESERTGDMLGSLISKIAAGGVEMRDLSSNTEMALTSLQNSMGQQVLTLNATMQQISDRQRSLTVALDAQRDVLNGLLNRLALVQDETASTAERTVARLTDGTQQISKQLETIDARAKDTLASVHAASAGFADEAGSLGLHAQQAEQQMRAVLSVTAGMQEQARQLREQMQSETARVVEQMTTVIAQLENAGSQMKQQSGAAVHIMDQSAIQFESVARSSGEQLQKHAENLSKVAQQAEARLEGSDEKLRGHLRLVTEAGDQAERQACQMADATEQAVTRIGELRTNMADSDKEGRQLLTQIGSRIDEVKAALQNDLQRFAEASQVAAQQVVIAAQGLGTQSDALRANLASSESALNEAAQLIRDETVQLPATLDRSTTQIHAAAAALKEQAKEADKTLLGTADRFIAVTGTARAALSDEMRHISVSADNADQLLRQFNKSLAEQVGGIQNSMSTLSNGQQDLVSKAGESMTQLALASDRLAQLRNEATTSAEKLSQEFGTLEQRAAAAGQRLAQAGEGIGRNVEALAEATQRAETQMLSGSNSFREQLERIRGGVQGQIDDINRGLMQITAQLERTGNTLRSTTAGTVADVEKISQRFEQTSKEAATQLVDKTARMRVSTEEVARLLSGFGDQLDVLLDRLSMAGDGIKRHEGDLTGQMQTALTHLSSVAERLESTRALASNVSEQAVGRLAEVSTIVEKQMAMLSDGSQTVTGLLRNVSQVCGDQTQSLNKGVSEAQSQVVAMNKSVEDMQQRTDRLRVSLKLQGEELLNSLTQIQRQLAATGDAMGETVDNVLQDQANKGLQKMV
jgi:methyl-accepting chemotaxis protein